MGSLLCHLPCTCSKAREESPDTEVLIQLEGRADTTSLTRLQECKPVKAGTFPTLQPLQSAGTQAGRHCDTCKSPWSCACLLAAVREGTKGICDSWEAGRCVPVGLRHQLLLNITGDIIYSQHSTTAHLLPTHWEPSANSSLSLPSLLEPLPSLRPLGNKLKTAAEEISFATGLPSFFLHPFTTLALGLRALPSSYTFTFLHLSPPWWHWWWQMATSPALTHLSSHYPFHTSFFCYHNPLVQTSPQNSYFPEEFEHKLRDRQVQLICINLTRTKEKCTKFIWHPILKVCSLHFWKLQYTW